MTKRLQDYGIQIGCYPTGPENSITDVPGVMVGHCTISNGPVQTGVTAILPHTGDIFHKKVPSAVHIINGFAKAVGLIQIAELGVIETPILLTNTLSVGMATETLVEYMLEKNPDIGRTTGTVNPVVLECNDGYLNDIRRMQVSRHHIWQALNNVEIICKEGAVGAGTGMSCFGLKGGIGTSSRCLELDGKSYIVGVMVLTNFGLLPNLIIDGFPAGHLLDCQKQETENGSVIIIVATDIPLSDRQLGRIARRTSAGLARTGSHIGNGSGEIALAFSTGYRISHYSESTYQNMVMLQENLIDSVFRTVIEATEEAVLNSMLTAESVTGYEGHTRPSLSTFMESKILKYIINNNQMGKSG